MNYQESVYMNMAHMPEADRFALEKEVEANLYQFDLNKNSFIDGEELDEAYMFLVDSTHPECVQIRQNSCIIFHAYTQAWCVVCV